MRKILALALAGGLIGFAGTALAHDMSGMSAMPIAVEVAAIASNAVTIDNFAFAPASVTVAAGTTVTWTNRDNDAHTITSTADPKLFHSAALDTGASFSFTFAKPGTYQYFCSIHPRMVGTVVVK
ncbi:MAG TPA: cupredoxin family copper-binding protein [Stellaceae bacterium]|nr:cupredoxin family copper-binding protein [Stellaceae bacterium]